MPEAETTLEEKKVEEDEQDKKKKPKEKKEKRCIAEWVASRADYQMLRQVMKGFPTLDRAKVVLLFKEKATKRSQVTVPAKTYVATDRMNALFYAALSEKMDETSLRKVDFVVVVGYDFWQKCGKQTREQILFRACCEMGYGAEEGPFKNPPDYVLFKQELARKGYHTEETDEVRNLVAVQLKLPFPKVPAASAAK